MPRPDDRPLRRLPTLTARKDVLERCVFCPKLCRSACPVSNAEPRETLTPWGKMSMAYFSANGSVALAPSYAAPAWACTGCFGCREHCDHKNDVTGTLLDARHALVHAGVAPPAATRTITRFDETSARLPAMNREMPSDVVDAGSKTAVLVGCAYARHAKAEAVDAVRAAAKIAGGPVSLVDACCGAPLLHAGDAHGFAEQAQLFARAVEGKNLLVVDAGCASTIGVHYPNVGVRIPMTTFVAHVAREAMNALRRADLSALGPAPFRWHDPCQLGRGLAIYDEPRDVLARILGERPGEFERCRSDARCSGAGGLLPLTYPDVASTMAAQRGADHERSGGGTIVTACASSLRSFRKQGLSAIDLASVIATSLGVR